MMQFNVDFYSPRTAVAGDGAGNVTVAGRANWYYARLGASDGEVVQFHSASLHPNDGDFILISREGLSDLGGWRLEFWLRDGSDATRPSPRAGSIWVR